MRKLAAATVAAVASGLLVAAAPPAQAAPLGFDCHFVVFSHVLLTGSPTTFTGLAVGYSDINDNPEIRCYVEVNGSDVASTPTGTGIDFAATAGQVTFTAEPTDYVRLCASPSPNPAFTACHELGRIENTETVAEPLLCPVLDLLEGLRVPGVIEVADGDLFVLSNVRIYDCLPYGSYWPQSGLTILFH